MSKKRLTGVRRDRPRPLWGDHWPLGSFWDALFVVRSKIKTASAALVGLEAGDFVALTLDATADELERLAVEAKREMGDL